jgi:hypothetical protein
MPASSVVSTSDLAAETDVGPAYVFGLRVDSELPLRALPIGGNKPGRSVELRCAERTMLERDWPKDGVVSLIDRRTPAGRLVMSVDLHSESGYRIAAPGYGMHVVSADGRSIASAVAAVAPWRWQRLLFAQVLPLAATLQGLELFHASAVALGDRAVAFVATSGTGKSSLAVHLVARGARYVADDVVAVEAASDSAFVHPGPAVASVHRSELRSLGPGADDVGVVIGRSDKLQLEVEPVAGPRRLEAVYFLERLRAGEFAIDESPAPDPRLLLASTFISYLTSADFLLGHLDACARIAGAARVFHVKVPPDLGAGDVAAAVETHIEGRS